MVLPAADLKLRQQRVRSRLLRVFVVCLVTPVSARQENRNVVKQSTNEDQQGVYSSVCKSSTKAEAGQDAVVQPPGVNETNRMEENERR